MADKEYIEREALIAEYDRVHEGEAGKARKLMVDAPAADVVEVRHGEWLAELVDEIGGVKLLAGLERIKHTCSACGFVHKLPVPWRLTWNYCPHCGAKMMPQPPKGE